MPADAFHHHALSAVAIAEPGGADGRSRADVAGEKRGEDERRAERAAGDEEIAGRADVAANPQADRRP